MLVDAPYGRPGDSPAETGDSLNYQRRHSTDPIVIFSPLQNRKANDAKCRNL